MKNKNEEGNAIAARDIKNLEEVTSSLSDGALNTIVTAIPNRLDGEDGDTVYVEGDIMRSYKKVSGDWYEIGEIKRVTNSNVWSQRRLLPNVLNNRNTTRGGGHTRRRRYAKELSSRKKPTNLNKGIKKLKIDFNKRGHRRNAYVAKVPSKYRGQDRNRKQLFRIIDRAPT